MTAGTGTKFLSSNRLVIGVVLGFNLGLPLLALSFAVSLPMSEVPAGGLLPVGIFGGGMYLIVHRALAMGLVIDWDDRQLFVVNVFKSRRIPFNELQAIGTGNSSLPGGTQYGHVRSYCIAVRIRQANGQDRDLIVNGSVGVKADDSMCKSLKGLSLELKIPCDFSQLK